MSKAEEKSQNRYVSYDEECAFIDGYEQAEKDLELTCEDISKIISIDQQVCGIMGISDYTHNHQQAMEEVLKRFKSYKERKEK